MIKKFIKIISYQGNLKSATYGLYDMFMMANHALREFPDTVQFDCQIVDMENLEADRLTPDVIIIPPSDVDHDYYLHPDKKLIDFLCESYESGCMLASACAGSFILAATGKLKDKVCTTHWVLQKSMQREYPDVTLNINAILVNEGSIITAGGMMSWIDLGFELIAELASPALMNRVGKLLVMDTAKREQRFYKQFVPDFAHSDEPIKLVQTYMRDRFKSQITTVDLAEQAGISVRTLQRRFLKVTGMSPTHYLQKLRLQKACELLESTILPFETIAYQVGYQDVSAFRKLFKKDIGLLPKAFRERFGIISHR